MMSKSGLVKGKPSIGVVSAATLALIMLAAAMMGPAEATSPGTAGAIAFVSDRDGSGQQVYRMGSDGFGQTRLTDTLGVSSNPSWSPDGNLIAFSNCHPTVGCEIYLMNYDGSGEYNLTDDPGTDGHATWFPSGNKIAFASVRSGDTEDIYVADLDGFGNIGPATRITTSAAMDLRPAVSPDGKKIAFESQRDGDYEIYVMKARRESPTNRPVRLTNNSTDDYMPDWSPDGSKIAFTRTTGIFVMKPSPESRTNRPKNLTGTLGSAYDPAYSPDGKRIAFVSSASGNADIWRMRSDGSNQVNITRDPAQDHAPAWQPIP
jgi:Tol biopolymer transport system component